MVEQEKLTREEVLRKLEISDDTLALYEQELQLNAYPASSDLENFTSEDLQTIKTFHKLRESGLTYNEVKLLSSFSEILMNIDFEGNESIQKLLSLSPIFRLKQSLNLAKQELNSLRAKALDLDEALKKELESHDGKDVENISLLQEELEIKQKTINNLDRKLSETLLLKSQLEIQLQTYKETGSLPQAKGKKAKQLQETLTQKEKEISELILKSKGLQEELDETKGDAFELKERLELTEEEIIELEQEVEEKYKEQLTTLREQVEGLIDTKQKEWESYYISTSDQHRKEILTLQRKHEQDILRLKQKLKEQAEEIEELKTMQNPLMGLFKMGSSRR